jgi:LPXTG-site transpeptidase (sortase) family protein
MKERLTTFFVAAAVVCAVSVFASTLAHASLYSPPEETTVEGPSSLGGVSVEDPTAPERLIIPSLDIDANVQDVGRGKTGNMAVPSNYTDVGWYRYGPRPGEVGSAVIDGHVDNGFALDAVFKHLKSLSPGDDIYVETKGGVRLHFVVEDVKTYDANEVPAQKLFLRADGARLNLITCAGDWQPDEKSYNERVVIYTRLVS